MLTDRRGNELRVGRTVCFNYSGYITVGVISKIVKRKKSDYWGNPLYNFHVQRFSETGHVEGVSKVTDARNLMVIHETEPVPK